MKRTNRSDRVQNEKTREIPVDHASAPVDMAGLIMASSDPASVGGEMPPANDKDRLDIIGADELMERISEVMTGGFEPTGERDPEGKNWEDLVTDEAKSNFAKAGYPLLPPVLRHLVKGIDPVGSIGLWREATIVEIEAITDLEWRAKVLWVNGFAGSSDVRVRKVLESVRDSGVYGHLVASYEKDDHPSKKAKSGKRKVDRRWPEGNLFHDFKIEVDPQDEDEE